MSVEIRNSFLLRPANFVKNLGLKKIWDGKFSKYVLGGYFRKYKKFILNLHLK
jgi:hypothetical protein